jgi:hypothetical protein
MKLPEVGQKLVFTKNLAGSTFTNRIAKGDTAIYLGNSQAKILTGESKDWLVTLQCDAPVELIN